VKVRQSAIFAEMSKSSLYQALQESYLDLGPGTMALLIQDIGAERPIHCEAIPISDLLIIRGPYGMVSGFFRDEKDLPARRRERALAGCGLFAARPRARRPGFAGAENHRRLLARLERSRHRDLQIRGAVPGQDHPEQDLHRRRLVPVHRRALVARSDHGLGRRPDLSRPARDQDHQSRPFLDLKNYDKHVDPPTSYEDDGVMNVDGGVRPGDWIPRAVGSERRKRSRARRALTSRCSSATNCAR
jgi:hypothetical protein